MEYINFKINNLIYNFFKEKDIFISNKRQINIYIIII